MSTKSTPSMAPRTDGAVDSLSDLAAPSASQRVKVVMATVRQRHHPWLAEMGLIVALYWLYSVMRSASPDRVSLARSNSHMVETFERAFGLDVELALNHLFVRNAWLADAASLWYQIAHMAVTAGVLLWLWHRHHDSYGPLRSSLVVLMVAGLATYWIFPLAPPRFALRGAVDTMITNPVLFAGQESVTGLANMYAAMPSLHVGWAFWCALAVVMTATSRWRYLAWIYPMITTFVVVGTANHYLLDAVAGCAYGLVAYAFARSVYARVASHAVPAQVGV